MLTYVRFTPDAVVSIAAHGNYKAAITGQDGQGR